MSKIDLKGLDVLVTGASGGMGSEVCKLLLNEGARVFALDNKPCDVDGVVFIETDITKPKSIENAFEVVQKNTDRLYAILHFAGIYRLNSLIEISESEIKQIFDINFLGAYRVNKTFFPLLNKGSRIMLTSSELAPLNPLPFTGLYAITKATLEKYAYSLRMEVQVFDIDVVVLRPGAVKTEFLDVSTEQLEEFCKNTKLYDKNAKEFMDIVKSIEERSISAKELATKVIKMLKTKCPKYVYSINRNRLLKLLNILPKRWQTKIIKNVIKD